MKCDNCNKEITEQSGEFEEFCPHCDEPIVDEGRLNSITRFKWYFVGIVIFCFVMILYLPR